jgi:DNA-binding response OmpR family regulator
MKLPAPPTGNNYRILIVEDDATILKLISMHLSKIGFECRLATDGLEGWQAFKEFDPHLVLTDISMPGFSGHELAAKVRAESGVPIVLMTAQNTDDNEMQSFKSGGDDYVEKPFKPQLLVARVAANLRRAYRYSASAAAPAPTPPKAAPLAPRPAPSTSKGVPDGWSTCDHCGYIGPQFKFENLDQDGNRTFVCPHCKHTSFTYSLG